MRLPAATAATQERPTTRPQPAPAIAEQEPAQSLHAEAVASRPERVGLRLLGPLELTGCKKTRPRRQATRELLAFLALQHGLVSREALVEALWPGEEPRRSGERFNQAATEARRLLGDAFQRRRDNHYQLDRRHLDIDLDQLEQLHQRAREAYGDQQRALLERALALFRGEPFAGIDALWADAEARRLRALQSELLDQLGRLRLGAGDATGALAAAEHAAMLDRSNERPIQLAMEAEAALGQRDAIIERYERLCRDLDEQYGLGPSRETKQLYRRLLSQDGDAAEQATIREQAGR
jgi:DNA-binding SARP family transcriptional activator